MEPAKEFTTAVAAALRRSRTERHLSLADLSSRSGVSRAMLSQIESGKTTPSIAVLWKIAAGLEVPFSALLGEEPRDPTIVLRGAEARVMHSADGQFHSRALFRPRPDRRVEFYELTLAPGAASRSQPHAPGTFEMLTVTKGHIRLTVAGQTYDLHRGDSIEFPGDTAHAYGNPGRVEAVAYDVILYA